MAEVSKPPKKEQDVLLPKGGGWQDDTLGCFNDPGLCIIVGFCNSISLAQLYERMVRKGIVARAHSMLTCINIAAFLWFCYLASDALQGVGGGTSNPDYSPTTMSIVCHSVGSLLSFISWVCGVAIVLTVRKAVRKRDGIPPANCGEQEDIVCAICCNPCTQCQVWRHEQVKCGKYSLCNPTGSDIEQV